MSNTLRLLQRLARYRGIRLTDPVGHETEPLLRDGFLSEMTLDWSATIVRVDNVAEIGSSAERNGRVLSTLMTTVRSNASEPLRVLLQVFEKRAVMGTLAAG